MFRILNKLQQGNKRSSGTYGEVAQLARARGSYPRCRGFKSPPRYLNEEIRNVGCPAFLFFVFGKYENTCREDFLNRMMQNIQYLSQNSAHNYPFVQGNFVKGITLGGVKG